MGCPVEYTGLWWLRAMSRAANRAIVRQLGDEHGRTCRRAASAPGSDSVVRASGPDIDHVTALPCRSRQRSGPLARLHASRAAASAPGGPRSPAWFLRPASLLYGRAGD